MKTIQFDKYKHKMTKWVTTGIIKSITFRDKLYRQLKSHPVNSPEYYTLKTDMKTYNTIHKKYQESLERLLLWPILLNIKMILGKLGTLQRMSSEDKKKYILFSIPVYHKYFYSDWETYKFEEYFCEIGPKLAKSIPSPRDPHVDFQSNLGTPFLDNFIFEEIIKHIQNLKPKSSSGYDQISSKLLKEIGPIISQHLCHIINQSLCTGIFPARLKV